MIIIIMSLIILTLIIIVLIIVIVIIIIIIFIITIIMINTSLFFPWLVRSLATFGIGPQRTQRHRSPCTREAFGNSRGWP